MKVKLLHLTLSMETGGIEHCICNICDGIDKKKYDITVGCLDSGGTLLKFIQELKCDTFIERRAPGLDWKLISRLVQRFRAQKYHIVHTHNQAAHFYGGIAARLAGVPVVITSEHSRHNIDLSQNRILEKKFLYKISDQWVLVSEALYGQSVYKDKLNPIKLTVIQNGIDIQKFKKGSIFSPCVGVKKKALSLPENSKVLIMVARLHPIKNHEMLLDAYALKRDKLYNLHILFAGEGECSDHLKSRASELNISDHIHFLGDRQDINELLWLSDAFLLCSHSEGFPLSLIESAAAMVPVIITRASNKANFIQDGFNGVVIEHNKKALADSLIHLIDDHNNLKEMAVRGFDVVKEKYSVESMTDAYDELYTKLLTKKGVLRQNL